MGLRGLVRSRQGRIVIHSNGWCANLSKGTRPIQCATEAKSQEGIQAIRNFLKLASGVDVSAIAQALVRHPELWNQNNFRTTFPGTPHVTVDDILLRFSDTSKCDTTSKVIGDDFPIWLPAADILFPSCAHIVYGLMAQVRAYQLDRLIISRIPPGGEILPHADNEGDYVLTDDRARYHCAIQGLPGSLYHCGNETVQMLTGEIWWFNAHEIHSVVNNSVDDRIHLLIDVRTR